MSKLKKALDRAKLERVGKGETSAKERNVNNDSTHDTAKDSFGKKKEEINVQYSATKVLDIDPTIFKKNKIFSHMKENEMTEQFSIIRTQILNKLEMIGGNTFMVTSAHPGEGKTFTSINLGISIAQQLQKTVLLVDCDLRKPERNHFDFARDFFGVDIAKGLSDYLLGQAELADILLNPSIPRLTILPGGRSLVNSAELLGSPRMEQLVEDMKTRYGKDRIIIFDSPSVLKISDPLAFSRYVDGILLIVEAERTSADEIKKVMELFKDRVILGTILNKARHQ